MLTLTLLSFYSEGLLGVAESTVFTSKGKPFPWGEFIRQGGWGRGWKMALPRPSPTVCDGHPSPGGRGFFVGWWILRLHLWLRTEWKGRGVVRRVKVFILEWPTIMESGALCIGQCLMLCVFFYFMLWVLALEWWCSYWLLIGVCIGFELIHVLSIK